MTDAQMLSKDTSSLFRDILGPNGFFDDEATRTLMSQDIWSRGRLADFVLAPSTIDELSRAVALAHTFDIPLNPRGGGMSYTNGYTPDRVGTGIIDFSRLNRITEINADDMYVTAQAGTTWKQLHEALAPLRLRTPFWGPLSGISSTLGGGLSQNNAFFGAGLYGPSTDSVTGLGVVLADGTYVRTGTAGGVNGKPFWRHYGPDLTGLFLGDAGAFGYKAEASLRLIRAPEYEDWAAFEFSDRRDCAAAMAEVAREGLASEVFGFDPNLTAIRLRRASLLADTKALANVVKAQGSLIKGIREGAKVALAGRGFVGRNTWSLNFVVEGRSRAGVTEDMSRLKAICRKQGGEETENSIPKIIRANPFGPANNILGPDGERWVPVHGIVPLSAGATVLDEIQSLFEAFSDEFAKFGITDGYLITTLSTNGFLIEPVFLWPEERFEIHDRLVEPGFLKRLPTHPQNAAATECVARARQAVIDVFSRHGGAHFQVGRTYPYTGTRTPEARALVQTIKHALDPRGRVNPGALGL